MPSLDEFFAEAIEQADPTNMVEEEYKWVCTATREMGVFIILHFSCPMISLYILYYNIFKILFHACDYI